MAKGRFRYWLYKWLQRGKVLVVTIMAFIVLGVMLFFTYNFTFLSPVKKAVQEFSMTDIYYQILQETGSPDTSPLITIVDMTEMTSRRDLAQALEDIEACGPKIVGVDIILEGRKDDVEGDEMITQVAANYQNIIWSMKLTDFVDDEIEYGNVIRSFFTDSIEVQEGVTNMQRRLYGGVKRRLDQGWLLRGQLMPSFSIRVLNGYADKTIYDTEIQSIDVNFTPTNFSVVDADSVLMHPELIADRIVLFGAMSEESDMHYTPLGKIPGIVLLAYSIQTLLSQTQIVEVKGWPLWICSFILIMITYWERVKRKTWITRHAHPLVQLILGFPIISSIISFLWMALALWLAFLLFCGYDISFNLGISFSAIAFLTTAEYSYLSLLDYLKEFCNEQ